MNAMLHSVLLALIAIPLFIAAKAIEIAIKEEYVGWASALARLLVELAGNVCPSRRDEWRADLLYRQREDRRPGLYEATSCLVSAPGLALKEALVRALARWASPGWDYTVFNDSGQVMVFPTYDGDVAVAPHATAYIKGCLIPFPRKNCPHLKTDEIPLQRDRNPPASDGS